MPVVYINKTHTNETKTNAKPGWDLGDQILRVYIKLILGRCKQACEKHTLAPLKVDSLKVDRVES